MFYTPDTHVVLRDGSTLRIRPLASDDHRWLGTIETIVSANRDAAFMRLLPSTAAHVRRVVDAPPDEAYAIVGELGGRLCAVAT